MLSLRYCWLLIMTAILTGSCHQTFSKDEFLNVYMDSMKRLFPNVVFVKGNDNSFTGKFDGKDAIHYIDNAYADYERNPDSIGSILHRFVTTAVQLYTVKSNLTRDNIVPVIKPRSYVEEMSNLGASMGAKKEKFDGVFDQYNADLVIAYAEDTENGISYFPENVLGKSGIPKDSLRSIATENLYRLIGSDIKLNDVGGGLYMLTAGGNYEASIILFDEIWTKGNMPVNGDFVIGIPSRDVLLVTGGKDKANIQKLKEAVAKSYGSSNYTVSPNIFRRVNGVFVPFE